MCFPSNLKSNKAHTLQLLHSFNLKQTPIFFLFNDTEFWKSLGQMSYGTSQILDLINCFLIMLFNLLLYSIFSHKWEVRSRGLWRPWFSLSSLGSLLTFQKWLRILLVIYNKIYFSCSVLQDQGWKLIKPEDHIVCFPSFWMVYLWKIKNRFFLSTSISTDLVNLNFLSLRR